MGGAGRSRKKRSWVGKIDSYRWFALALAGFMALAAPVSSAEPASSYAWRYLGTLNQPYLDVRSGELWGVTDEGVVQRAELPSDARSQPIWHELPPVGRCRPSSPVVAPDRRLYVTCSIDNRNRPAYRRDTVMRLDLDAIDDGWEELQPDCVGSLAAVAIRPDGSVWVGGERREVFRLASDRWEKIVTEVPYHNDAILWNTDGSGWLMSGTHGASAILRTEDGKDWQTVRREPSFGPVLYWESESIWVHRIDGVARLDRDGSWSSEVLHGLPGSREGSVALSTPNAGHLFSHGRLSRWEGGALIPLDVDTPFNLHSLIDYGDGLLFAIDEAHGLWRLTRTDSSDHSSWPPLERMGWRGESPSLLRPFALGLLRLESRSFLHVLDHEWADRTFPIDEIVSSAAAGGPPAKDWARTLGVIGTEPPQSYNYAYDLSLLIGDLNGDRREDMLTITMYDGLRLWRNDRDRRFVDWTAAARLPADSDGMYQGGCLFDADADGDLDVYFTRLLDRDVLLVNNGSSVFTDLTDDSGLETIDGSSMATCTDLDADGDTDIAVATWGRGILLHENQGDAASGPRFSTHVLSVDPQSAAGGLSLFNINSLAMGDLDRDGLPEMFAAGQPGCDRLFWNLGALRFEERSGVLPPNQPCTCTAGGDWADFDHDGRLDLVLAGCGGSRFYRNTGNQLTWSDPTPEARWAPIFRASVLIDLEADGDLDVIQAGDHSGTVAWRNQTGGEGTLVLTLEGPASNPSAIGARVELYRAGHLGSAQHFIDWDEVQGSSGHGCHGDKALHFAGLDPDARVDILARTPAGATAMLLDVPVPFHGELDFGSSSSVAASGLFRARHFLGDPWNRRWLVMLGATIATCVAGVLLLFPRRWRSLRVWSVPVAAPFVMLAIYLEGPLDPGLPVTAASFALSALLGLGVLAWLRTRVDSRPTPELFAELDLALRTFQHNQTPRRVFDSLELVLRNVEHRPVIKQSKIAVLLLQDTRAYREVVLPELASIARLAHAVGLGDDHGSRLVERQRRSLRRLIQSCEAPHASPERIAELGKLLSETRSWLARIQEVVDEELAVDLAQMIDAWVATRTTLVSCVIRHEDRLQCALRVRFITVELHRVLDVLLENAVQAANDKKPPRLEIESRWDGRGMAQVLVRDDGPGLAPGARERLFSVSPGSGKGYGLFFAQRTLQRFGGRIALLDEPGGTCFLLELPAVA